MTRTGSNDTPQIQYQTSKPDGAYYENLVDITNSPESAAHTARLRIDYRDMDDPESRDSISVNIMFPLVETEGLSTDSPRLEISYRPGGIGQPAVATTGIVSRYEGDALRLLLKIVPETDKMVRAYDIAFFESGDDYGCD